MKKWDELPQKMKNDMVRNYYLILKKQEKALVVKRLIDIVLASILVVILLPLLVILSICIKLDSKGPVMFRQVRVTSYGKEFRIFKFRTMVDNAKAKGAEVTTKNDSRITRMGKIIRKYRLDEIPQLFNVLYGDMTFVGTRPEVVKYVKCYTDEMLATLLLPAGITSKASIEYKDEERLLDSAVRVDEVYINQVLPAKMKCNLKAIEEFSIWNDVKTMFHTLLAVIK